MSVNGASLIFAGMKLAQKLAVNYLRARLNLTAVLSRQQAAEKAFDIFCTPFYKSKTAAPAIFEKGQPIEFRVHNTVVRGHKWNQGGSKRILILHGFESSAKNFDAYVRVLTAKNYEVLAFDAPAHGRSDGKRITLPDYIHMIEAIYYQFGGLQGMIAHSFGGLAAAHALELLPDNENISLALVAPATETTTAIDTLFRFLQLGKAVRTSFNQIVLEKSGYPPEHFSIGRAIQHIKGPVLWVHDENDEITPLGDVAPVMDAHYSNVSFFITQGLGHRKIYRDDRVVRAVAEFL